MTERSRPFPIGAPEQRILGQADGIIKRREKNHSFENENPLMATQIEGLPRLDPGERRIRVDPFDGSLYISSWRRKKTVVLKDDQQSLDLELPARKSPPSRKRWSRLPNLEAAIRSSTYIYQQHEAPKGEIVERLNGLIGLTDSLLLEFGQNGVNEQTLPALIEQTMQILEKNHFLNPKVPNKEEAVTQILKALGPDSLGRKNPLISRTRIASAGVKLIHELLIAGKVEQKYSYILSAILLHEREVERFYLQEAVRLSEEVVSYPKNHAELYNATGNLLKYVRQFLAMDSIRCEPYRFPSLIFSTYVFGFTNSDQRNLIKRAFGKKNKNGRRLETATGVKMAEALENPDLDLSALLERLKDGTGILQNALMVGDVNYQRVQKGLIKEDEKSV